MSIALFIVMFSGISLLVTGADLYSNAKSNFRSLEGAFVMFAGALGIFASLYYLLIH